MDRSFRAPRTSTKADSAVLLILLPLILGPAAPAPSPAIAQETRTPARPEAKPPAPSTRGEPDAEARRAERERFERIALAVPSPESSRKHLRMLTDRPHVAGTPADRDTAFAVRDLLRSWGWAVQIAEYEVLLNYPKTGPLGPTLRLLRPELVDLPVIETPFALDKDSAHPEAFPAFHGYGVSGDVKAQVVYANYGRPEDFEALEKLGVDVRGRIVLVRYGELFRGLKIRNAQKRGAIGVLIYSDPMDDGFMKGDVYPNGPYRPGSAIQRGSVQFLSLGPGDPSTPGVPSLKGAKRLPIDPRHGFPLRTVAKEPVAAKDRDANPAPPPGQDMTVSEWERATGLVREDYFATIPSLPISYEAAQPILSAMGGAAVPPGFQGGLPLTYHTGPGPAEVEFRVEMDYAIRTVWNVVATLPGTVEPDRWIMVGNHRDAWVFGAADPSSGTAATLEMCRALGAAVSKGWKPRRTIVYASWDAEEYGLVGSTEWADEHADEIEKKALLMLNVDTAVAGPDFDIDGVPSLRDFLLGAAREIPDVRSGKPLADVWTAKQRARWAAAGAVDLGDEARPLGGPAFEPQLGPLGSGSDYTAFLDHLGVPAIDVAFTGRYGVYHAIQDNFFWMEKFCDPEFIHHATAAKLYTLLAMRAASDEVVPLRFTPYAHALREAVDDYRRTLIRKARAAQPGDRDFPFAGLSRLIASVEAFHDRAVEADRAAEELAAADRVVPRRLTGFNDEARRVEGEFLLPRGLPGRPWFRHAIYAPGLTTGYAAWVFPGLRQAIIDDDPAAFALQVVELAQRIDAAASRLARATLAARSAEPTETPRPKPEPSPKPSDAKPPRVEPEAADRSPAPDSPGRSPR
ncbi:MAG: M28 family metallopeptidase [Isosphaeraceae bacterium]|nr:M28 family metallopeptidase [Isosphaeraceae bacterium]